MKSRFLWWLVIQSSQHAVLPDLSDLYRKVIDRMLVWETMSISVRRKRTYPWPFPIQSTRSGRCTRQYLIHALTWKPHHFNGLSSCMPRAYYRELLGINYLLISTVSTLTGLHKPYTVTERWVPPIWQLLFTLKDLISMVLCLRKTLGTAFKWLILQKTNLLVLMKLDYYKHYSLSILGTTNDFIYSLRNHSNSCINKTFLFTKTWKKNNERLWAGK